MAYAPALDLTTLFEVIPAPLAPKLGPNVVRTSSMLWLLPRGGGGSGSERGCPPWHRLPGGLLLQNRGFCPQKSMGSHKSDFRPDRTVSSSTPNAMPTERGLEEGKMQDPVKH